MAWNIYQNISINYIRVDSVTNSSVLQIGSSGSIQALSQLYNTGGFTGPAPQLTGTTAQEVSLVRLPLPV
ncbi:spore gernimation protein [Cohnella sp. CFH 77786]|uniref:spore germination protein GerPB n=1 Tax=Cohnella sp. CFH 77786 TaxID=2662265 RepID=UPI001C608C32|nr:spore germination protein GerPB [Cohnella sp. CFH 77786]MBW5446809.1 spore gernimation protein [Cohnella sp. CFH 77786]